MAEYEELKIGVVIKDDAGEKLRKLKSEGDKFNADVGGKVNTQLKTGAENTSKFAAELRGVAGKFTEMANLPIFRGGIGLAAIVTSIKIVNDQLGAFAKGILNVRDLARTAGLDPGVFKNYVGQLKLVGYTSEQAEQEIIGFFRTVDEAGRAGTPEFQRIWHESFNPEVTMRRIQQMRELIRTGEGGKALTQAAEEAKAIMAREIAAGHGQQEARRQAEAWLSSVGLSMRALNINDISDFIGDPQKWARRIEAAEQFNTEYTKMERLIGEIGADIQSALLPAFKDLNEQLAKSGGFFEQLKDIVGTDIDDYRKILALAEGDMDKLGRLLPPGPLRKWVTGNTRPPSNEAEGPPTREGVPPISPSPWGQITGGSVMRGIGNAIRGMYYGPEGSPEQQKNNEALKDDVQQNELLLKEIIRLNDILFSTEAKENLNKLNDKTKPQGQQFHNSPMGGAKGESNPIELPATVPQPGGGAAAEARKSTSQRLISDLQRDFNYTRAQAAGISGSLAAETSNFRFMQEKSPVAGRGGYGFAQWTGPRRRDFERWAAARDVDINSYEANYGFLKHEATTASLWKKEMERVHGARTAEEASRIFTGSAAEKRGFLRPGKQHYGSSARYARQFAGAVAGTDVSIPSVTTGSEASTRMAELAVPPVTTGSEASTRMPEYSILAGSRYDDATLAGTLPQAEAPSPPEAPRSSNVSLIGSRHDPGVKEFYAETDRALLDQALGLESGVEAKGSLDVNVTGAPADVRVSGDGMFKGNTTMSQQVELQQ